LGGATNREAAAQLFLLPNTVNTHLQHAYAKLGVRTRVELARLSDTQSRRSAPGGRRSDHRVRAGPTPRGVALQRAEEELFEDSEFG
jgi:hypothetical protein